MLIHDNLRMDKSRRILIYPDPVLQKRTVVILRHHLYTLLIRDIRCDDAHIHAPELRLNKRIDERLKSMEQENEQGEIAQKDREEFLGTPIEAYSKQFSVCSGCHNSFTPYK